MKLPAPTLSALLLLAGLACGDGSSGPQPQGQGYLWVRPSPAKVTPGASVTLSAVPDQGTLAPGDHGLASVAWNVLEADGGAVVPLTSIGDSALYTAPTKLGSFHVQAVGTPTGPYLPKPGVVDVIDPATVSVATNVAKITIGMDGPFPTIKPTVIPLTNQKVTWSIAEADFAAAAATGVVTINPDWAFDNSAMIEFDPKRLNELPGTLFHIKVQSLEAPLAFTMAEVDVVR